MYEAFFDLEVLPFKITPDPAFIYWDKDHIRAASVLAFGMEQLVPITVVTGDVGTGKTTLLQHFLEEAPADVTVGLISNFSSGMGGLYQWILNAFNIQKSGTEVELFRVFEDFVVSEYAAGRRCALIVDEAQNVSDVDLEQLRMLTNINVGKDALLMLFLVGQQQLRDRLLQSNNRQIAQRVGAAFHLGPLTLEDTKKYVRHRISVAGGTREIFEEDALEQIYQVAGGVPRLTNVLCELALVTAFGEGTPMIDGAFMRALLAEAAQTGLIAHLPMDGPALDRRGDPAELVTDTDPAGPSGSKPFHNPTRRGNVRQQIRLVSDPWESEEDKQTKEQPAKIEPAAHSPEPVASSLPAATPAADDAEDSDQEAQIMESVMALTLAKQHQAPDAPSAEPASQEQAEPTEAAETLRQAEPSTQDPLPQAKLAPVKRRWIARLVGNGMNVAVVLLLVGAGFALLLMPLEPEAPPIVEATSADSAAAPTPALLPAVQELTVPSASSVGFAPAEVVPLDNPDGADLLDHALNAGVSDPQAGAIAYARAALRGNSRAAYYLGQLFETGDGVTRDLALARAWYSLAGQSMSRAQRRLADLPDPEQAGDLPPPIPLLGGPIQGGGAEFVWTTGPGTDPALFVVEVASATDAPIRRLPFQTVSALQVEDIGDARVWRVLAADPATRQYTVSEWAAMGADPQQVMLESDPVLPDVTVFLPVGASADLQSAATAGLTSAGMTFQIENTEAAGADTTVVGYTYDADKDAAAKIAQAIGDDIATEQGAPWLVEAEPQLPGQIAVRLASQ